MNIDPNKPWPFPSNIVGGDSSIKTLADTLAMLEDFTAFQLRGDIYYGYQDKRALKTIEGIRKAIDETDGGCGEA